MNSGGERERFTNKRTHIETNVKIKHGLIIFTEFANDHYFSLFSQYYLKRNKGDIFKMRVYCI